MKRMTRFLLVLLAVLLLVPAVTYAAPKGYKEVSITKKNFKKYFEVHKYKYYENQKYKGYIFKLRSKLRKKGYYLYDASAFTAMGFYHYRYKLKRGKKYTKYIDLYSWNVKDRYGWSLAGGPAKASYKYAKIEDFEVAKAKGKLVFVTPGNVIGLEENTNYSGDFAGYRIKLKYPYNNKTPYVAHVDEKTGQEVIDYYYMDVAGWEMANKKIIR